MTAPDTPPTPPPALPPTLPPIVRLARLYAPHRAAVASAIAGTASRGDRRLAVLGAGPCLDLDLRALLGRFDELTLVDLDAATLQRGVALQLPDRPPGLVLRGDVDVTGLAEPALPTRAAEWIERLGRHTATAAATPQDGIVSLALLSQLVEHALARLAAEPAAHAQVVAATLLAHLHYMLRSLRPGGWGLLVTDVVASETMPALLARPSEAELAALLAAAKQQRNHFFGLNPDWLVPPAGRDPSLDALLRAPEIGAPWVWTDAPGHARLMVALRFRRAAG